MKKKGKEGGRKEEGKEGENKEMSDSITETYMENILKLRHL